MSRNFVHTLNLKVNNQQLCEIESVSQRLGLEKSEVARRAITIGLRRFAKARLPGSPVAELGQQPQLELNLKGGK
jgi:hypothetical protein